jgi:hypothetical protein
MPEEILGSADVHPNSQAYFRLSDPA